MENLLPKAVVGLGVLLPPQCLHCPCVKYSYWDLDSLAVSNLSICFSQFNRNSTSVMLLSFYLKLPRIKMNS